MAGGLGHLIRFGRIPAPIARCPASPTTKCPLTERWAWETRGNAGANHGLGEVF